MTDPEADRAEAAQRPSADWDRAALIHPLITQLDTILDTLGCKAGLHEWDAEYTGTPPGPNRNMTWSTTRLACNDCGQTATLTYDPPPTTHHTPEEKRLTTTDEIAQTIHEGREGSSQLVKIRSLPASLLYMAVRKAWELMGADAIPGGPEGRVSMYLAEHAEMNEAAHRAGIPNRFPDIIARSVSEPLRTTDLHFLLAEIKYLRKHVSEDWPT